MTAFALYRLPHEDHATLIRQTEGEPAEYLSCAELNGRRGFVVAPFQISEKQPVLLIRPDEVETVVVDSGQWTVDSCDYIASGNSSVESNQNCPLSTVNYQLYTYSIDFANFHSQLDSGVFRKIVLARCADEETSDAIPPLQLFHRACTLYPRMFIALVNTAKSGCWLTATPEILLEGKTEAWRTIALAGTMKLEGEQLNGEGETLRWSTKNIQEQRIVATYITECLEQFTGDFHEEGPRTVRASGVTLRSRSLIASIWVICCMSSIPRLLSVDYRNERLLNSSFIMNIRLVVTIVVLWACSTLRRRPISMCRCVA